MATEAGYVEPSFHGGEIKQITPNTRGSNKRKRGVLDQSSEARGSARRTSNYPPPGDIGSSAPTANMNDPTSNTFLAQAHAAAAAGEQHNAHHFDLSALQTQSQSSAGHGHNPGSNSNVDTAAAALTQHYSMQVPPHPADSFMNQPTAGPEQAYGALGDGDEYSELQAGADGGASIGMGTPGSKPAVGSDEWHKQRKDNHKEVERRRRETINEGINELAKIVPGCEKNKGSILARTVQYITKLHDDASQNIDKWTFEKLVTEQAINDLSSKLQRAWQEKEAWKRIAKEAGVDVDDIDLGLGNIGDGKDMGKVGESDGAEKEQGNESDGGETQTVET